MRRLVIVLALAAIVAPAAAADDWTRYGYDAQVTNDIPVATAQALGFDPSTAGSLHQVWRADLDGPIVASPLYLDGQSGTVYVATNAGSVYALRASDGSVIWKQTFPTVTIADDDCGTYGISSTGVIDRDRGVLYVADADGDVHALDLITGAEPAGWPLQLPIDTATAYVWGGLTLAGSTLYVPVASYCDTPDPANGAYPNGGLYGVDVDTPANAGHFQVSPPETLGGIWGYGGASVDPLTGDLWVTTGNSEPLGAGETQGYAETVDELDPSLGVVAWNRPPGIPDADLDTDFGSTPTLFQPDGCPPLAAAYNKNGELYVFNRDDLDAGAIWSMVIGPDDLATPFVGQPSWSADNQELVVANARVYDPTVVGGVTHFAATVGLAIGPGCTFPTKPTWIADVGAGVKPPALIVGNDVFVAGGDSSDFSVLDARTGALLNTFFLENDMFSSPILAGDEVIVGNAAGTVFAIAPPKAALSPKMTVQRLHLHRVRGNDAG